MHFQYMTAAIEFCTADRCLELIFGTCIGITSGTVATDSEPSVFGFCRVGCAGFIADTTYLVYIGNGDSQITAVVAVDVKCLIFVSIYHGQSSIVSPCYLFRFVYLRNVNRQTAGRHLYRIVDGVRQTRRLIFCSHYYFSATRNTLCLRDLHGCFRIIRYRRNSRRSLDTGRQLNIIHIGGG